jgi:hypothetical protein
MAKYFGKLYIYRTFTSSGKGDKNPLGLPVTLYRSKRNQQFACTVRTLSQMEK